jgi:hypothetical protein
MPSGLLSLRERARSLLLSLSPRQRQYAMLGAILLGGVGLLWLVFASGVSTPADKAAKNPGGAPSAVTNIGVMPPGQQVNPVDQWVGTAGSKLAQGADRRAGGLEKRDEALALGVLIDDEVAQQGAGEDAMLEHRLNRLNAGRPGLGGAAAEQPAFRSLGRGIGFNQP